jgi:hypothetical protein
LEDQHAKEANQQKEIENQQKEIENLQNKLKEGALGGDDGGEVLKVEEKPKDKEEVGEKEASSNK